MATAGEGSHPIKTEPQQPMQPRELEPRVVRRRLSQARRRATLAGLFNNLKKIVYSESDFTASKSQVLNKAKSHIQELEENLNALLKLKETFNLEDGNPSSLEKVKEEYAEMFSRNESLILDSFLQNGSFPCYPVEAAKKGLEEEEGEEEEEEGEENQAEEEAKEEEEEEKKVDLLHFPATSPPDLLEFERYLTFYQQTMDLLVGNGIVSLKATLQPVVSAAISHLWQTLSEDRKDGVLQAWAEHHSNLLGLGACPQPACAEDSVKDSGVDSQGATCSLVSTPEEVLFEDTIDVTCFVDKSEIPGASYPSSGFACFNPENPERKLELYLQITNFLKYLCCISPQLEQAPAPPADDEMMMLRCLETFEDEDL